MNIGKVDGTLFVVKALSFYICSFKITKQHSESMQFTSVHKEWKIGDWPRKASC